MDKRRGETGPCHHSFFLLCKMRAVFSLAFLTLLGLASTAPQAFRNTTIWNKQGEKKIYIHLMPWFETKETSGNNQWGIHWTMANKNPDNIIGEGNKREIAAHYYPDIHPYGSGDPALIDYQIQQMKYSGADGVMIDWPGTTQANDYPKNHQNCIAFVNKLEGSGLEFAVVYEDRNLVEVGDRLGQAQADMSWLRDNWMNKGNYIKVNGAPLLTVFGPITLQTESEWAQVLSVFPTKPTFLTLWYERDDAGGQANGEYAWVYLDFLEGLRNFYNNRPMDVKMGVVYPGFHDFYSEGGWGESYFFIDHDGTNTFKATLDLALASNAGYIQAATWNDYGEGTIIEPTREFGNEFLTIMQGALKVPYGEEELNLIKDLYLARKATQGQVSIQVQLDQVNDHINHLEPQKGRLLLDSLKLKY